MGRAHVARTPKTRSRRGRRRGGFTLLETMLAMTIVLVGVLSVLQAQRSFLYNNQWSTHAATASYLANEVRELTRALPRHDRFAGGVYFATPGDPDSLAGWGPEASETAVADLDDLDDFDGAVFGDAATLPEGFAVSQRFPGPINAFGQPIAETTWDGQEMMLQLGDELTPVRMQGWTQVVTVDKVDPSDFSVVVDDAAFESGERDVHEYPVRVTVTVLYQGVWTDEAPAVTEVSWVVSP